MLNSVKIMAAGVAGTLGLLAFAASPALASVPAPNCESGGSIVDCIAFSGTSPFTWTITQHFEGTSSTYSYTTTPGNTRFACNRTQSFGVSYSYVAGGVTQKSGFASVVCNPGQWP